MPHDLGTWGFILSVTALALAIPLGIAATLLAPKLQVWWFVRSVRGTANKLWSLSDYRDELKREPLFSTTETMIFEQQFRLMNAVHLLAYVVVLAIVFTSTWKPAIGPVDLARRTGRLVVPFALLILGSWTYFIVSGLKCLLKSSPNERKKIEKQIELLVLKLSSKTPPR